MTATATEPATSTRRDVAAAQHLINGEWTGEPEIQRINPARQDELAALSPRGTADDVDAAITAAAAAQPAWAALPAPARGAILMTAGNLLTDRQSAIAEDLVREEGKTLAEAMGEVKRASDVTWLSFHPSGGSCTLSGIGAAPAPIPGSRPRRF